MSEPEDVILEGAYAATTLVAGLWSRHRAGPPIVALSEVRQRLELLIAALYPLAPAIVVAEPPAHPSLFRRLAYRVPRHLLDSRPLAGTDGSRLRLPRTLDASAGREAAFARFRLYAVQQALRALRGTARHLPHAQEPLLRDLYLLAEASAIDATVAAELPGLHDDLRRARTRALVDRPAIGDLTGPEAHVEGWVRSLLESEPGTLPPGLPASGDPSGSLAWAHRVAVRISAATGRYRGIRAVEYWGRVEAAEEFGPELHLRSSADEEGAPPRAERVSLLRRRPRIRQAAEDEDDEEMGMWMLQTDDPLEHTEDPMGLQRPTDRDEHADPDDLADSLSELPEARLLTTPSTSAEILLSEDPPDRRPARIEEERSKGGIAYPEWDWRLEAYHPGRAIVRSASVALGSAEWADQVLRARASQVHRIRRQFEALRPQRLRLGRQPDGAEVDLTAYVTHHADLRAGCAVDDRLYEAVRAQRRDIAFALLVDLSGSTDSWISAHRRVIDVEKEALLLVCEALDALGDRFGIFGFSGEGPAHVMIRPIKDFSEPYSPEVARRIAGVEPDRYTRLGAALRHTAMLLSRERARHRLLLLLSDGKPNDIDSYEGRYGIEDTRQAVAEARILGLHPYCLTIDRQAPIYLSRLFGAGGYSVLRDAEAFPQLLIEVVRRLLKS